MKEFYKVYRQDTPIPTGKMLKIVNHRGEERYEHAHNANLVFVGYASSFEQAKRLCVHPLMEASHD